MNYNLDKRFWEVDSLRGLAILMMVVFHLIYDLDYFGIYNSNVHSGLIWVFGKITASIFIFLVGVSLSLSYSRTTLLNGDNNEKELFLKYLKRGLKIFSYGLLITIATWLFIGNGVIIFGILHFIGIAIILEYPFLKQNYANLFLGIIFMGLGIYLMSFTFDFNTLFWLGFAPNNFYTLDYYPLLPWLGVVSIGIFIGNILYKNYIRQFKILNLSNYLFIKVLRVLGQYSLFIYLIHQPILIIILLIFAPGNIQSGILNFILTLTF